MAERKTPWEMVQFLHERGLTPAPVIQEAVIAREERPLPVEQVTLTTPFPLYFPAIGFIKPTIEIPVGGQPRVDIGAGVLEVLKPTRKPGEREIIQPLTALGALPPEFGKDIPEELKTIYIEETEKVPHVPPVIIPFVTPPVLPKFPDIKNALIIGAVAIGGLFLIGKLLEGRKRG